MRTNLGPIRLDVNAAWDLAAGGASQAVGASVATRPGDP